MDNLPKSFKRLFTIVTAMGLAVLIWSVMRTHWSLKVVQDIIVFGSLLVLSESLPVPLPKGGYVTVGFPIVHAALILFPSEPIPLVAIMGALFVFGKGAEDQPLYKRIFNASQYVLSISAASWFLTVLGMSTVSLNLALVLAYFAVALVHVGVNITIVSIALGALQNKSPWSIWMGNIRWSAPYFVAMLPLGFLMALVYQNFGPFGLALLFIPLMLSRHSFQLYIDMRQNYLQTIEALVQALEAKDTYTSGHSERVAELSLAMAEELGMPDEKLEFIKYAGILHDVGKIGVDEGILNKKGPLLDSEWEAIRSHPVIGENIIKKIKFLFDISPAVRHHHERFDGKGYPDGLQGENIPLEARIIAVADTFDAITSNRSYREGKTKNEALRELQRVAGTQLDPEMVKVFLKVIEEQASAMEAVAAAKMA